MKRERFVDNGQEDSADNGPETPLVTRGKFSLLKVLIS